VKEKCLGTVRVLIRSANAADHAVLLEFRFAMLEVIARTVGHEPESDGVPIADLAANERWLGEHLGRDLLAWIADVDGRPAATASLMWFRHPPSRADPCGLEAYVLNVYTRPEARRMGLARALMERLVEEARAAGTRRIWLRTSPEGLRLYESLGFRTGSYLQLTLE
jgi:GNAT superfamily N-acetyltransferase